ncbi:Abi family protein [Bifidobacterium miconisargentati]|uniref:Abi family protein n=1 Tax=Bifidobacterium miconisargentati TaxID=2834437 RepID=UPI001BDCA2AB|nr:Abi family protein [Bifidobacterium miconisargentati]MBW3090926.1 Abi family protein [Bifidobacterium miconisargentati]
MQNDIQTLNRLFGEARFKVYLDYAKDSMEEGCGESELLPLALELYRWNIRMSTLVMGYVAYIEVFVRNSIDECLCAWISEQPPAPVSDWIDVNRSLPLNRIRRLLNGDGRDYLEEARNAALRKQQLWKSDQSHPRHNDRINRNDVFAQLTFGAWDGLLRRADKDAELAQVLLSAFPNVESAWALEEQRMRNARLPGSEADDRGSRLRRELADRLKSIRNVRNRAGHEENLLRVEFPKVRRDMLFVLGSLGTDCIQLALPDLAEPLKHADPRRIVQEYSGVKNRKEFE